MQCPSCGYEAASLVGAINDRERQAQVDEERRRLGLQGIRQENFRIILDALASAGLVRGARLLDVGSAHGWFLELACARYTAAGIEPDAAVGAEARSKGLDVRLGYFPQALTEGELFDVITFNDVIEHIPDIDEAVSAARAHLGPRGLLVLSLPNSEGTFYRLAKLLAKLGVRSYFWRLWQAGFPSPHVHYFNPTNLARFVSMRGYSVERTMSLPSISPNGLAERIGHVGKQRPVVAGLTYVAVMAMLPIISRTTSDSMVLIFRRT